MYFSNNSRCVLRKARLLSPNYFNKLGKNLSVKKPKDDPTKPPLRINIPDDDREDLLVKNLGAIEVKAAGSSLVTFQDDVFQKPDTTVSAFEKLRDNMMGESSKESTSKTSDGYSSKSKSSDDSKSHSEGMSFDYFNNYSNVTLSSDKEAGKPNNEEVSEEHPGQKSWFILLDVDPKNKEAEVPNEKSSRQFSRLQHHLQEGLNKSEARKAESFSNRSKNNSKLMSKSDKKRGRFEVQEVEDDATYILYVRLNRQLQKKSSEVGYVPEKDFSLRARSPVERFSMNDSDYELEKQTELDKERKKQKARKNEMMEASKEPDVKVEANSFAEHKEKQDVKRENEKLFYDFGTVGPERDHYVPVGVTQTDSTIQEKPEEYRRTDESLSASSQSANTSLEQFQSAQYASSNLTVSSAETQSFAQVDTSSQENLSQEEYKKPNENLSYLSRNASTTLTESQSADEITSYSEVSTIASQKANAEYFSRVQPAEMSKVETSATVTSSEVSTMSLPTQDSTTETRDSFSEIESETARNIEALNVSSMKKAKRHTSSKAQYKKPLSNVVQYDTVSEAEGFASEESLAESQTYYKNQNKAAIAPKPEKKTETSISKKKEIGKNEYLNIHDPKDKVDKSPKNKRYPPNIWSASQERKPPVECSSHVKDFQTCSSSVTIDRTETVSCPVTFSAAFPPLLKEALSTHLRLKNNFSEKWKNLSKERHSTTESNIRKYSENSILFPKAESEELDCESLFMTKEQIILSLIKNHEDNTIKNSGVSSMDSLSMMKKVKEIVQLDLDNVVKIFDGGSIGKNISSVVVLTPDGWKVNQEELETQIALRKSEIKLELMDLKNNMVGNENVIPVTKYLPTKKESPIEIQLPNVESNSAIMFNPKTNEFFICKEALAEAISKKTNEPLSEITETLNLLAKNSKSAKDLKKGDSILVFDEDTQSWKVDFTILEKRQQQLQLEEELAKASELILDTFEKLEKNQINVVPTPSTKDKKTFDYVNKQWKDIKSPVKKSTDSKYPLKDSNAEEIRKKNSDLYENLFVAKRNETKMKTPEKKAPGVDSSKSKKESKSGDLGGTKESSTSKSEDCLPVSKSETPDSSPKPPTSKNHENDNFWEEFLKMNILPKDISEISKTSSKPEKQREAPSSKLPPPSQRRTPAPKKETEGDLHEKKTPTPTPPVTTPSSEKNKKPTVIAPPPSIQISKEDPKKPDNLKKVDLPKPDISKQPPKMDPPKLDILKQPPKVDPSKSDISKQAPKVDPSKTEDSKQPPKGDPPKSDTPKQTPKLDPRKTDISKPPPKAEPSKWDILKFPRNPLKGNQLPPKVDPPTTDPSKQPPKGDPPKSDTPKQTPKLDPPKPTPKSDLPKEPPKSIPPKEASKSVTSKPSKVQDPKAPTGTKSASSPVDHYVSDKIIEISKTKGKDLPKTKSKIETVKLNITPDTRLPSKITEINLNKKFEKGGTQKKDNSSKEDSNKKKLEESQKEKTPLFKKFEKYRTPFNDPEYEEKSMKIKSDLVTNPNLKKLDNWNKTLVLHDIMKPPENIETWLKDETDKMATLLLKILQDASDAKPKKKPLPAKPKLGEKTNPYENIRKKQENTPENFLFRVRTVNLSLQNENKKLPEDVKPPKTKKESEISQETTKVVKPTTIVDTLKKIPVPMATFPQIMKTYHLPTSLEDQRNKVFQWGGETIGDFVPSEKESQQSRLIIEVTEDIPGPEILKKISNLWKFLPVLDSQITVFTLLRVFQLVNLGRSFLSPQPNSNKYKRTAFSKLFSKYGPIVNVRGPLSGNVILIYKPEHFAAVFEQDFPVFVRSVFDSLEQVRRDADDKFISDVSPDWTSSEWTELRKLTNDTLLRGCEKYMAHSEISVNSLIGVMRKNKNGQDMVSDDFMEEIKRWSLEGLCSVLFEKSFGFMEGKITNLNWIMEPEKLYVAVEKATQSLSKCEAGFQLWRIMPTPSSICLSQAYSTMTSIFRKQIIQAGINLRKKNEFLRDGGGLFHLRDITLIESMMLHDGLSREEINCNLVDMMLIGANVLNSATGFLLYNLAINMRAQSRLFQELKEALPSKSSHLDYNTLTSLKYLQACVKENFRLHMPFPLLYRMLQNDISLHNYFIPKGAFVVMDQRASSQKQYVFENPEKFLPERWLTDERWMSEYDSVSSFPLCHGPKSELARNIMKLQLYTVIAKIVRNFHLEYHYGEIHSTNSLISFPDKPLKLNFIERVS